MAEDNAIAKFDILPDYASGFTFYWAMRGGFNDPLPWTYVVQMGFSQEGPWSNVSPELKDVFAWKSGEGVRVNKARSLFFRVSCKTGSGEYLSDARSPYGNLSRQEYLIGREIMRREVLHMKKLAGSKCHVWMVSNYGPKCPHCLDPITGQRRNGNCRYCYGTGFYPAYIGPFETWCIFSENNQHQLQEGAEGIGMIEQKSFQVRMASSVPVKKNDIVCDLPSGKRYYVGQVQISAELRRVPLVQTLLVNEIATTDPAYRVGMK